MSRNATVWRSSRRTALRGGRTRKTGKAKGQLGFRKPVVKSTSNDGLDPEVILWMSKVDSAGGTVDSDTITALNNWIKTINSKVGLREKLKRVNLFCGDDIYSSSVPIIADAGNDIDSYNNFDSADYTEVGASAGLKSDELVEFIDTGLNFTDANMTFENGHFAINSVGSALSNSYREWGGRSWNSIGSSMTQANDVHFRWGDTIINAQGSNPQSGISTGFYIGTASSEEVSIYQNANKINKKDISSINNAPSSYTDKSFHIFKRNSSTPHESLNKTINFYSLGLHLTDEEVKFLYDSVAAFNKALAREVFSAQDEEVWEWANHRVNEIVGDVSTYFIQKNVDIADQWMLSVKSSGLRPRLSRVNLLLGGNTAPYGYLSAFCPLIIDSGNRVDVNYNFTQNDFEIGKGLKGDGISKRIDTKVSANSLFGTFSAHASVNTRSQTSNESTSGAVGLLGALSIDQNQQIHTGLNINFKKKTSGYELTARYGDENLSKEVSSSNGFFAISSDNSSVLRAFSSALQIGVNEQTRSWNNQDLKNVSSEDMTVNIFSPVSTSGTHGYSDQYINFYSLGEGLSGVEVASLNGAVEKMTSGLTIYEATDSEAWNWANIRVPKNGGVITQKQVNALNAFMKTINATSGLRSKIKRVNLNLGSNNNAKLVPVIKDDGADLDDQLLTPLLTTTARSDYSTDLSSSYYYVLASGLSSDDSTVLNSALSKYMTDMNFDLDSEVYSWVYDKVIPAGGSLTQKEITAVNTFMAAIKAESGLRDKIKRLNLFVGDNILAAQTPLISDNTGSSTDTVVNMTSSSLNQGLSGGVNSYMKTGLSEANETNITTQDLHLMVNVKGSLPSKGNAYAISNYSAVAGKHSSCSLSITNTSVKFYHDFTGNDNKTGSAIWNTPSTGTIIGSKIGSGSTLYVDGSSKATGDDGANKSIGAGEFQVFASNGIPSFNGRITAYSIGLGLSASQAQALSTAVDALNKTLLRGEYLAIDPEVWDWANVKVKTNSGTINQQQVDAVDKWMLGVKSIYNLRESIQRCNLFVGQDLNAALTPVISDLGPSFDTAEGFVEADYTSTGAEAGLKTTGKKTLNTGVNSDSVLTNNYHMAFRSPSKYSALEGNEPIMGTYNNRQVRAFYDDNGEASFVHGSETYDSTNVNYIKNYLAGYVDYPEDQGVSSSSITNAKNRPAPIYSEKVTSADGLDISPAWIRFKIGPTSDLSMSLCTVKASDVHGEGNAAKLKVSLNGQAKLRTDKFQVSSGAPDGVIRVFGVTNAGSNTSQPYDGTLTMNYYSFGKGPQEPSSSTEDVLELNFKEDKMNKFLVDLDCDLGRSRHTFEAGTSYDTEVVHWVNEVLPTYGGVVNPSQVDAVNKFMLRISSIRNKINRLNLFVGENLAAGLTPIIRDAGHPTDLNKGSSLFNEADFNPLIGLCPWPSNDSALNVSSSSFSAQNGSSDVLKFLDTGIKAGSDSKIGRTSGHVSFATSVGGRDLTRLQHEAASEFGIDFRDNFFSPFSLMPEYSKSSLKSWLIELFQLNDNIGVLSTKTGISPIDLQVLNSNNEIFKLWFWGVWGSGERGDRFVYKDLWKNGHKFAPNAPTTFVKHQDYVTNGNVSSVTYFCDSVDFDTVVAGRTTRKTAYSDEPISSVPEFTDSTLKFLAQSYGDTIGDSQGARIPYKHFKDSSGNFYSLTTQSYLINQISNYSKSDLNNLVQSSMGSGWEVADWDDFSGLSETDLATALTQLGIYDTTLEYETVPEKPIGFCLSDGSTYSNGQFLAHWMNKKVIDNYSYNLESGHQYHSNYWVLRKVNYGDAINASAPILIKHAALGNLAKYGNAAKSFNAPISFYSVGDTLIESEVAALEYAYGEFCWRMGRQTEVNEWSRTINNYKDVLNINDLSGNGEYGKHNRFIYED